MTSPAINVYSKIFSAQHTKDTAFYKSVFTTSVHQEALLSVLVANSEQAAQGDNGSHNLAILRALFVHGVNFFSDAIKFKETTDDNILPDSLSNGSLNDFPIGRDASVNTTNSTSNSNGSSVYLKDSRVGNNSHRSSVANVELDNGGDDITSLNGRVNSNVPAFDEFDDGDDITTLNGNVKAASMPVISVNAKSRRESAVSLGSTPSLAIITNNDHIDTPNEFENIDDGLRGELAANILLILQVWFKSICDSNERLKKSKNSLGISSKTDLATKIFYLPGTQQVLDENSLLGLLSRLKFFLNSAIEEIEVSETGEFSYLLAIKEAVYLIAEINKTLFASLTIHKESTNEFVVIKSLIFTFCKVDFSETLDRILTSTNPRKVSDSDDYYSRRNKSKGSTANGSVNASNLDLAEQMVESGSSVNINTFIKPVAYESPRIRLSSETLLKVYIIIDTLANIPTYLLPVTSVSLSSDITNMDHESPNPYETLFGFVKAYDHELYVQEISSRLVPILALDFNYCYGFRSDLLEDNLGNNSLFNWLTANRFANNLYSEFNTAEFVTNLAKNGSLSLLKTANDPYLQEIEGIYQNRIKKEKQKNDDDDILDIPEFLPIALLIYTYSKNPSFLTNFSKQAYPIHHKIEDIQPTEDTTVELYEIWLCVLSYVFQYQYRSVDLQWAVRLSLQVLLRLTSRYSIVKNENFSISLVENVKNYQINEYKWKLSHQKLPFIPNSNGRLGIKSSLFYILDVVQNLIRFNMNNKLNVVNFKMALNVTFQVLQELHDDREIELGMYSWIEFHNSLFNLLKFIKKQKLATSKYFVSLGQNGLIDSLIEEILVIINFLLRRRFNEVIQVSDELNSARKFGQHAFTSINYDLVYHILLHYEVINDLLVSYNLRRARYLSHLNKCLTFFEGEFHLTEESKINEKDSKKLDLFDHDFDSPILIAKINSFTLNEINPNKLEIFADSNAINHSDRNLDIVYKSKETFKYSNKGYDAVFISDQELVKLFQNVFAVAIGK